VTREAKLNVKNAALSSLFWLASADPDGDTGQQTGEVSFLRLGVVGNGEPDPVYALKQCRLDLD
jgi:hypothetical protein